MANQFYYVVDGQTKGPVDSQALIQLVQRGIVVPDTKVSTGGAWYNASEIKGLVFPSLPPPLPAKPSQAASPPGGSPSTYQPNTSSLHKKRTMKKLVIPILIISVLIVGVILGRYVTFLAKDNATVRGPDVSTSGVKISGEVINFPSPNLTNNLIDPDTLSDEEVMRLYNATGHLGQVLPPPSKASSVEDIHDYNREMPVIRKRAKHLYQEQVYKVKRGPLVFTAYVNSNKRFKHKKDFYEYAQKSAKFHYDANLNEASYILKEFDPDSVIRLNVSDKLWRFEFEDGYVTMLAHCVGPINEPNVIMLDLQEINMY